MQIKNDAFGVGLSAIKGADDLSDLGTGLDHIQSLGVDLIELPIFDYDLVIAGRVNHRRLAEVRAATQGRGIAYSAHGPLAINPMDPDWAVPRHLEVMAASMDVAAGLEAYHYVLHAGMTMETLPEARAEACKRQRDFLHRAGELAAARGLIACVETLFEYDGWKHTPDPVQLAGELEAIAHPALCATIDFSHSYLKLDAMGRREEFVSQMKRLAPFARHLHIHDSFGRQDEMWAYTQGERLAYGHGDLHLPPGEGDIPWEQLITECCFPAGVVFNIELDKRYWHRAAEAVAVSQDLCRRARTAPPG
ncbi:sugar phosphate isomerase/epimerase family protein [Pseudogemmobacter faecipullorum]|uniref:Sugar phosphate isomerase/epimerase n=1 Tax=Pseudogemmobacter faecipullorum TaxID=2755041 RepID=A0ABS8CNI2_9RHOB|nr:sugar phosphate isomerase/epimerase [Pseudogemmobacter faecipullorum]MCB5410390.1 sugar phosphate isomerase/epimerase [Pseudogemmobacter faecipullorum]